MTNIKHTKGACILCGCQMTSYGMSRHLSTCAKRNEAINIANQTSESAQYLYHLKSRTPILVLLALSEMNRQPSFDLMIILCYLADFAALMSSPL